MNRDLARPAIFGSFDGASSLLGVVVYLLLAHPSLIFPAALSGAVTSALSMGAGEWLSDSENGFAASAVMALATFTGALLPAVPFAFAAGPAAVAACAVTCIAIAGAVSLLRPNRGRGLSALETFATLAACLGASVLCGLLLPGGAG